MSKLLDTQSLIEGDWNEAIKQSSCLNFDRTIIKTFENKKVSELTSEDLLKVIITRAEHQKNPNLITGGRRLLQDINMEDVGNNTPLFDRLDKIVQLCEKMVDKGNNNSSNYMGTQQKTFDRDKPPMKQYNNNNNNNNKSRTPYEPRSRDDGDKGYGGRAPYESRNRDDGDKGGRAPYEPRSRDEGDKGTGGRTSYDPPNREEGTRTNSRGPKSFGKTIDQSEGEKPIIRLFGKTIDQADGEKIGFRKRE